MTFIGNCKFINRIDTKYFETNIESGSKKNKWYAIYLSQKLVGLTLVGMAVAIGIGGFGFAALRKGLCCLFFQKKK